MNTKTAYTLVDLASTALVFVDPWSKENLFPARG